MTRGARESRVVNPSAPPSTALPDKLARPARRALPNAGFTRPDQLAGLREADIAGLHGVGPNALAQLRQALAANGLSFATDERKHG